MCVAESPPRCVISKEGGVGFAPITLGQSYKIWALIDTGCSLDLVISADVANDMGVTLYNEVSIQGVSNQPARAFTAGVSFIPCTSCFSAAGLQPSLLSCLVNSLP